MWAYTLCFVLSGDRVLMLHRKKAPNAGKWNGLGGRIEPGERPLAAALREVREESGLTVPEARFGGVVSWGDGGMYVYTAVVDQLTPLGPCDEGRLAWQPLEWVLTASEVVSNIRLFLPPMLHGEPPVEHAFAYSGSRITGYEKRLLPPEVVAHANGRGHGDPRSTPDRARPVA